MASIPKVELDALTDRQVKLHTSETGEIITRFHREFRKSLFHTPFTSKLKSTTDGDDVLYSANNNLHFLTYTYLLLRLPKIEVKKEFEKKIRICWCHNVATNIISDGKFEVDNEVINSLDHTWLDVHPQYFTKPGFREHYNLGVGNIAYLEEWKSYLPSVQLRVILPWFYSYHTSHAFPIFRFPGQTQINHRMRFRRKVNELLRMQISSDDGRTWRSIKPNFKYLHCSAKIISEPEMWAKYTYNTLEELNWQLKCNSADNVEGKKVYYINDMIAIDSENHAGYGKSISIELKTPHMCKSIFFMAENTDAIKYNNLSNYTTNSDNIYGGWDPIDNITLSYGIVKKFDKVNSIHFSQIESCHFPIPPDTQGYHAITYAWDPTSVDAEVTVCPSELKASLSVKLGNNDPFLDMEEKTDNIIPLNDLDTQSDLDNLKQDDTLNGCYYLRTRLLVIRKLTIVSSKKKYELTIV